MNYVEWLRVRGCLKWTVFGLGVLFAIGVIIRLALIGHHDSVDWAYGLEADPGSKVTHAALPDGDKRTVVDNAGKHVHVVIDDYGSHGRHIEIDDYSAPGSSDLKNADLTIHNGNIHESSLPQGRGTRIVIDTGDDSDETGLIAYVIFGSLVAFIVATVLGVPLARENDGHLEVALTKPISRDRLSAAIICIDAAGIVAALLVGIVIAIATQSLFMLPHVTFGVRDLLGLGVGIFGPVAWYSMLTAATASMKRGYGAVLGFAWPLAAIVLALSLVQPSGNAVLTVVHGIAWAVSFINPLTYVSLQAGDFHMGGPDVFNLGYGGQTLALVGLSLFYAMLSLVQWRRIEA